MKNKLLILVIALVTILATSIFPMSIAEPALPTSERINIDYGVNPVKAECFSPWDEWCELPEGTVPFNLDMVDAEKVCNDGEGIYVAVLDTGLLSNYLDFFPEDMVDIKEEWGIGFTHDLIWVGSDGNWSEEFDYGPLRDDRGFITHDYGNPTPSPWGGIPWGSGHGTHVTSTITGWQLERPDGSFWVRGVAPKVTVIPVLVLDDWFVWDPDYNYWFYAGGTWEMVAAGIKYIGDLAKEYNVKIVISMSLGGPSPSEMIEDAIDYAISQGVIIVAAAGNAGYEGMDWPGAYPQVISAAAAGWTQEYLRYYLEDEDPWYWWTDDVPEKLWTDDPLGNKFQVYLTDFSSRPNETLGQKSWQLDVSAPGAAVKGPYKDYGWGDWGYYSVWGTSMATPHVSAIAALVLESYPTIKQGRMELILKTAGYWNRLTKWCEKERSATIFDIFAYPDYPEYYLLEQTWLSKDYGTGLLQADEALFIARLMCPRHVGPHWR